ncbi:Zinc finger protein 235-like 1 [Homarus americanus]|uniref:Zinc finger protein 235-like 1 n=1 Tax=Homarus americanus TaxID=6706 RepID=A0A8J5MV27_HOMAM|nr:Zinc finger protein 235-like 1 [Homarus americanus]
MVEERQRGGESGMQFPSPTRRIVTVPAAFRKCPHCPTIFMDTAQLTLHLAQMHKDHQQERHCQHCRRRFLTYEDHTACDQCLQMLRQNALPSRVSSKVTVAGSVTTSTFDCGHCHQNFNSRVLAELHCLSTGHSMDQITATVPNEKATEDSTPGKEMKEGSAEIKDTATTGDTSSIVRKTKFGSKTRRGRKRRLIRKNQTSCETCGVECGSVSSLYIHLRSSHPALFPHQCGVCGRRFSLDASAREHERRHAVGELQCPACPLRFSRMSHLHHHARQHHPDFTSFPCQYCGAVTPTVDALHSHIKVHHGDRLGLPAAFTCEVCQETFHTGKALACHRSSRHPGTAVCGFCGTEVGSRYLSKHINAVHTKEKTHRCDKCGKDFYSRTSLTGHQKRQHAPRKHLCDLCGKGYVHNVELQRHLKAHRNQRDFKCDFCGRSFLKAVDLTYHRRSHTGERPHQCMLCPESFIRPLGLRKHMLKHTTVKKGKRLKYSKKKIEELTSAMSQEGRESGSRTSGAAEEPDRVNCTKEEAVPLSETNLAPSPDLTQPLQVFSETTVVPAPLPEPQQHLQSELQQLAPSDLQVQQLAVTDLDNGQLEGQLELSQVVEDLSSGELLEMGPGLLLETTDVHSAHEEGMSGGDEGREDTGEGEASQATQPVQVIYVQFVEEAAGWRSDPPL